MLWGRLVPARAALRSDDDRPAILLYCHPMEDKASIYKTLFEKSRSGIVIAAPVKNETGDIVDAWIIAQNEQARQLTGVYDHGPSDLCFAAAVSSPATTSGARSPKGSASAAPWRPSPTRRTALLDQSLHGTRRRVSRAAHDDHVAPVTQRLPVE